MKLVSACLAGVHCRYDCKAQTRVEIVDLIEKGEAIPVCPEQLGSLSTPRIPAERIADKIFDKNGKDVTKNYLEGANEALRLAQLMGVKEALLKSKSPMCGHTRIYDGTFTGNLIEGEGVLTELLLKNGIKVTEVD